MNILPGRVTATYRSKEMAHKFNIEAVHIHTSTASQIRHHTSPNIHTLKYKIKKNEKKFNYVANQLGN